MLRGDHRESELARLAPVSDRARAAHREPSPLSVTTHPPPRPSSRPPPARPLSSRPPSSSPESGELERLQEIYDTIEIQDGSAQATFGEYTLRTAIQPVLSLVHHKQV